MRILLEGPDGGGKTTLATTLFSDFRRKHNGPPPWNKEKDNVAEVRAWQLANLKVEDNVVIERSWISERIYGPILGRQLAFSRIHHRLMLRQFLAMNTALVFAIPPFKVAYDNWRTRVSEGKELLIHDWQFAEMYDRYTEHAFEMAHLHNVFLYDYTTDDETSLKKRINQRFVPNPHPEIVLGSPHARLAVVVPSRTLVPTLPGSVLPFERANIPEEEIVWIYGDHHKNLDLLNVNVVLETLTAGVPHQMVLPHIKTRFTNTWDDDLLQEAYYVAYSS